MLLNDDKASFSNFVGPESSALLFLPLKLTFPTGGCVIATSYFPDFLNFQKKILRRFARSAFGLLSEVALLPRVIFRIFST